MSATARRYRKRHQADLRALRDQGCTCHPDLYDMPRELWPAGVIGGAFVLHQTGCVFGDRVAKLNAAGITPSVFHHTKAGCQR